MSFSRTEEMLMTILVSTPTRHFGRWQALGLSVAILAFAAPVRAALIVSVQSVTVNAGSTGDALDVTLTNTGSTASVPIAGFAFEIVGASPPITFTAVKTATTSSPYIFGSNSTFGPDITIPVSSSTVEGSDVYSVSTGGISVGANSTVGLGHVLFNVSSTASGMIPVTLAGLNTITNLAGPPPISTPISIGSFSNGTITISGVSVPAPSSLVLFGLSCGTLIGWQLCRMGSWQWRRQRCRI